MGLKILLLIVTIATLNSNMYSAFYTEETVLDINISDKNVCMLQRVEVSYLKIGNDIIILSGSDKRVNIGINIKEGYKC